MSPAHDERTRIQAAMERIIGRRAQNSTGALTIVALAEEAGVPRNALTQRHTDLRDLFYEKVRASGGTPEAERRLRRETARLTRLRDGDKELIRQLKSDNEVLIRALHLAQLENGQLRRQLAEAAKPIHAIRDR